MAVSCELWDQAPPAKAGTSGDENIHDDQPSDSALVRNVILPFPPDVDEKSLLRSLT